MTTRTASIAFALALTTSAACGDDGGTHLGVAGASCVKTSDCERPLQCIANTCVALDGEGGADAIGGDAAQTQAPDATTPADTAQATSETGAPDVVTEVDVIEWEAITPDGQGPRDGQTGPGGEGCGTLGIGETWSGTFDGAVNFDLIFSPGPGVPQQGTLPVSGDLAFDITCVESKFTVNGEMDGVATVVGEGDYPFVLGLTGTYDPATQRLNARMVDGAVTIEALIEVYFEGTFTGQIQPDDTFEGDWEGESTGTNLDVYVGEADGQGTWEAASTP